MQNNIILWVCSAKLLINAKFLNRYKICILQLYLILEFKGWFIFRRSST